MIRHACLLALPVLFAAGAACAQSRAMATVNGVQVTLEAEGSSSLLARDGSAVVGVGDLEIVIGEGRITAGELSVDTGPVSEVDVLARSGILSVVADGRE